MDSVVADPHPCGVVENPLQPATVNGELRVVVAGLNTARFAPNLLTESVGIDQFKGTISDAIECLKEAELRELPDRMRQNIDADTQLTNAARPFE